jgi:hypothetical protein
MYSLNLISTRDEADRLLRMAQRDKRTINVRKETLALRNDNASDNEAERTADIAAAQAELDSLNTLIGSLPDGPRKETEITKKLAAELRLRRLTLGSSDDNPLTIVERSYDTDLADREVAGIDAFITAVEARKVEIG